MMNEAVAKLNITHFRSLLAKSDLISAERRAVQEEHKLDRLKRSLATRNTSLE
jgi:hypothetical protein